MYIMVTNEWGLIHAMNQSLIFVYNANSGLWNALLDIAHKIISPDTYNCRLCALTYGTVAMKREWRSFLKRLSPIQPVFLHADEVSADFPTTALPAVFIRQTDGEFVPLITAEELRTCSSLPELIELVQSRIAHF